jgi:hypothetical protein
MKYFSETESFKLMNNLEDLVKNDLARDIAAEERNVELSSTLAQYYRQYFGENVVPLISKS